MMILRLALQKIRAMAGGYGFFAAVLAAAFALFFIIAATLGTTRTQLLRIALTDEDDSPLSHEFAELLNDSDGEITDGKMRFVSVRFGTREESEEAVRSGKAEGALIILKGFGAGLESGEEAFLEYRASADASSAQAAEEIIGGRAVALRSRLRSADYAEKLLNRGLTEKELSDALHDVPEVQSILSYVDTVGTEIPMSYLDKDTLSQLVSENYSRMVLTVNADYEGEKTFELVKTIRDIANEYYPDTYYLAGEGVSTYDLMDTITADTLKVNIIAIAAVFIVLLLSFKSIGLPVILVLGIETAIWINLAIPYFADSTVHYIAYLIISSVQLGATVDYAILMTDRYIENRQIMNKKDAIHETVANVTVSILTSASVLTIVGFLLGLISTHGILSQLGVFVGRGALLSLAIVLFVIPGLLYLLDGVIQKTTLGAKWYRNTADAKENISK